MVVDCGHGATYHIAPSVFRELGRSDRHRLQPGWSQHQRRCRFDRPEALAAKVLECKADLGWPSMVMATVW